MKKGTILLIFFLLIITITSCKKENTNYIDGAIAIVYEADHPYLLNIDGDKFDLGTYDEIGDTFDDYIMVKKEGKYGFINTRGELVVNTLYDRVYPMKENKAVVVSGDKYQIISNNGTLLYEFSDGYSSESYFSLDNLVIKKDNKYSYLEYKDNNFIISSSSFDYAAPFKDNYAVVGDRISVAYYKVDENGEETDEIDYYDYSDYLKYTYIKLNKEYLFEDLVWDFADDFYEGWARVANMGSFKVTYTNSDAYFTEEGLLYSYINEDGKYLYVDFDYERGLIVTMPSSYGQPNVKYINDHPVEYYKVEYPFATNFNDGYCILAKYEYSKSNSQYLKEYMILDNTGDMNYMEAIYYATNYRYGYDVAYSYSFRTQTSGQFGFNKVSTYGHSIVFSVGNTLSNTSYKIKFSKTDPDHDYNMFYDIRWDHGFENIEYSMLPNWVKDYNNNYLNNTQSLVLLKKALELPYELDNLKYSKFYDENILITRSRILRSDKYGLIALSYEDFYNETYGRDESNVSGKYIIPPIYDKIVY